MDWFKSIKGWYNNGDGFWTKEMVADAVRYGKITLEHVSGFVQKINGVHLIS